jgi:hypothetical protein
VSRTSWGAQGTSPSWRLRAEDLRPATRGHSDGRLRVPRAREHRSDPAVGTTAVVPYCFAISPSPARLASAQLSLPVVFSLTKLYLSFDLHGDGIVKAILPPPPG